MSIDMIIFCVRIYSQFYPKADVAKHTQRPNNSHTPLIHSSNIEIFLIILSIQFILLMTEYQHLHA